MNKIIFKSLELAGFKNASVIAEVLNATPNPQVAAEMLLGIHEPISAQSFGQHWKHRYRDEIISVVSVNELQNEVTLNMYKPKTATMYYLTVEDYKNDNGTFVKEPNVAYRDYRSKKVPGVDISDKTMGIDSLKEDYQPISTENFVDSFNNWAYDPASAFPSPSVSDMVELSDNLPF